jgi:glyoxylase-like metal-dependent hydrolase (beta-lactamase superfamily II)
LRADESPPTAAKPTAATNYGVTAVRYATLRSTRRGLYYRYELYGEPDAPMVMDFFFWVLRGDGRTVLVDTGFAPRVGARRDRPCLVPPVEAVRRLGIDPLLVTHVVITHFHYDHIGNVMDYPAAELILPKRELEFWTGPLAQKPQFAALVEPDEVAVIQRAVEDGRVRLIGGSEEILPGVTAISVGGHSPGQLVLVVQSASGDVVLTSDAVHFYSELDLDRPFAVIDRLGEMYAAYDLIKELARRPGARLVAGHDPAVMQRFPLSPQDLENLAAQIA